MQQSLMPLHSVTASALLTSLLSVYNDNWGCLSEGMLQFSNFPLGLVSIIYTSTCNLLRVICFVENGQ